MVSNCAFLGAQSRELTATANLSKGGDSIYYDFITATVPQSSSFSEQLWDFSNSKYLGQEKEVFFVGNDSNRIKMIDKDAILDFSQDKEHLLLKRLQAPLLNIDFGNSFEYLKFPFPLNDSLTCQIEGKGTYCSKNKLVFSGTCCTKTMAKGKYQFEGGYCSFDNNLNPTYHYYEKDHLGSIRMVVNENGTIEQVNHYYPFGGVYGDLGYNSELQRNKYIGKEFDHTSGLDWYDHGARMYDAAKGSWDRVDKLTYKCSEVNPYCYCLLNPILKTDLDGNAPGDFFVTMDEAAIDFGLFYNAQSIKENKEYGSTIYEIWDVKKGKGYSYSSANTGRAKNSVLCNMPHNYHRITADIHTHGAYSYGQYNDNTFSGLRGNNNQLISARDRKKIKNNYDIGLANKHKRISYVVTPNGSLQKYDPQTGKIKVLSNDMPSDSNDPDRLNENNINYISIEKTIVQKIDVINFLYQTF